MFRPKQDFDFGIPDPHPMDCTRLFAYVDTKCVAREGTRRIVSFKYLCIIQSVAFGKFLRSNLNLNLNFARRKFSSEYLEPDAKRAKL